MLRGQTNDDVIIGNTHSQAPIFQLARNDLMCATQNFPDIKRHPSEGFRTSHNPAGSHGGGFDKHLDIEMQLIAVLISRDERGGPFRIRAVVQDLNKGRIK